MDAELRALGEDALAKYPDDDKQAMAWMIKTLLDNPTLFKKHVVPLVTEAARGVIRYLQGQQRLLTRKQTNHYIEETPAPAPLTAANGSGTPTRTKVTPIPETRETPPSTRLMLGRRLSAEHNWLHYPVAGKPLGDHTRESLLKCATQQLMAGHTQTVTGYFLVSVAERLTDDQKVCEVLDHTELAKMREAAEKRVA